MVFGLEKIELLQAQLEALARTVSSLESEVKSLRRDVDRFHKKHRD